MKPHLRTISPIDGRCYVERELADAAAIDAALDAARRVDVGKASVIGEQAARDPSAAGNPIPVDPAALECILRASVAGDLQDVGVGAAGLR